MKFPLLPWLALVAMTTLARGVVSFEWADVGDPGNPNDSTGFGRVDYSYRISTKEVTIGQYAEFLNAVASGSDPHGLYNAQMELDTRIAGIQRTVSGGSLVYTTIGDGNRPITNVSWLDCARFVNWVANGQGNGSTESGVYDMSQPAGSITRAADAAYFLPSENEWYKAAYYDPSAGGYWLYPTRSNTEPGIDMGTDPNNANFTDMFGRSSTGGEAKLTPAGAFAGSASYYGTYDQAGNAYEWNESMVGATRGLRGGSWFNLEGVLRSTSRSGLGPTMEGSLVGFRIASVPEPGPLALLAMAALLFCKRHRR